MSAQAGNGRPTPKLPRVETLTAFLAVDSDGNENILSYYSRATGHIPLIAADAERIEQFREWAEQAAETHKVRMVRFSQREDLEEL